MFADTSIVYSVGGIQTQDVNSFVLLNGTCEYDSSKHPRSIYNCRDVTEHGCGGNDIVQVDIQRNSTYIDIMLTLQNVSDSGYYGVRILSDGRYEKCLEYYLNVQSMCFVCAHDVCCICCACVVCCVCCVLCVHVLCVHVLCVHVLCVRVLYVRVLCVHVLCVHVLCVHVLYCVQGFI